MGGCQGGRVERGKDWEVKGVKRREEEKKQEEMKDRNKEAEKREEKTGK